MNSRIQVTHFLFVSLTFIVASVDARLPETPPPAHCQRNDKRIQCQELESELKCGQHFVKSGEAVVFSSKSVTLRKNRNQCRWKFHTPKDHTLNVMCEIHHELSASCKYSYLVFTDGNSRLNKLCQTTRSVGMNSNTGVLKVLSRIRLRRNSFFQFKCTVISSKRQMSTTISPNILPTAPPKPKCKCGRTNRRRRIVGGNQVEANEYPWQVALVEGNSSIPFCGGSIIADSWILTAAHCLINAKITDIAVVIGEHDWSTTSETSITRRMKVKNIIWHSGFRLRRPLEHDIGLVELEEPLVFPENNSIAPICLPRPHRGYAETDALVVGWGLTEDKLSGPSKELKAANVRTMSNGVCAKLIALKGQVTRGMICAGYLFSGENACYGDSGGPLLTKGEGCGGRCLTSIGVVSWGAFCKIGVFPSVYTRTNHYLKWIDMYTKSAKKCRVEE